MIRLDYIILYISYFKSPLKHPGFPWAPSPSLAHPVRRPEGEAPPLRHAAHAAAAAAPSIAAAGGVAGLLDVDEAFAVGEPP